MSATGPTCYVVTVAGHLDDHWSCLAPGGVIARGPDGTTTLTCQVTDQAQLYGLIDGLRDIGAALLEVRVGTC